MKKVLLYLNTIRYLRFPQIFYKIFYKFPRIYSYKAAKIDLNKPQDNWFVFKNNKKKELIDNKNILLLNQQGQIDDWKAINKSLLWRYHINYFDYASDDLSHEESQIVGSYIRKWIKTNIDFNDSPWDPYPTSLRIINWIKFALNGNDISQTIINSIAHQASHLSKNIEYHLYGNHLFRNGKALCFAGLFIEGKESKKWLKAGVKILEKEIKEQILDDGGNFELSPMYHSNMIEDALDLINLNLAYKNSNLDLITEDLVNIVPKLLNWLDKMCHPDKDISFFNDSSFNIALSYEQLLRYSSSLGIKITPENKFGTFHLEDSGYAITRNKNINLICDLGSIGPDYMTGHSHADCLSFELSIKDKRVFVNSGISEYENSEKRINQRKTQAHNTISINELDSSEVWQSFKVARRAYPKSVEVEDNLIVASHDGYKRNFKNITHSRKWVVTQDSINIEDMVMGNFKSAEAFFHIHPNIIIKQPNPESADLISDNNLICTILCPDHIIKIKDSLWFPEFGKELLNKTLCVELNANKLESSIKLS